MHIEKFKCNQISAILGHLKREHIHYNNENVDLSKTDNNVCYLKRDMEYFNKRMSELYVYGGWNEKHKAKYNAMASIVVHCPKGIDSNVFFSMMNDVLCKKYGDENVLCSIVHKDEKRDHMHFSFIPVVYNEKKKQYQLSYEKCLAHDFKTFHSDIEKALKEEFGIDIKLHDEENQNKFYFDKIEDYKKYKEHEENLKNIITNKEIQIKTIEDEIILLQQQSNQKESEINIQIENKQKELEEIKQMVEECKNIKIPDIIKNTWSDKKEKESLRKKYNELYNYAVSLEKQNNALLKEKEKIDCMNQLENEVFEINDSKYIVKLLQNLKELEPDTFEHIKYDMTVKEPTLQNKILGYQLERAIELKHTVPQTLDYSKKHDEI